MATSDQDHAEWEKLMAAAAECWNDEEAEKLYDTAVKLAENFGPTDVRLGRALFRLGWAGSGEARDSQLTRGLAILEKHLAPGDPEVILCLTQLLMRYLGQKKLTEAERVAKRLLAIHERTLGLPHGGGDTIVLTLGGILCEQRKHSEAERLYTRLLEAAEKAWGPDDGRLFDVVKALAKLYEEQERHLRAEPLIKRLLATEERLRGPKSGGVPHILNHLARLCDKQRRYKEAEGLLRRSIEICEKDALNESVAQEALAQILRKTGRTEEADQADARAKDLHERFVSFRDDDD